MARGASSRKEPKEKAETKGSYFEGVGRRKTAVARVRIVKGGGSVLVNGKALDAYFPTLRLREAALEPLKTLNILEKFHSTVVVSGGGIAAQAGAIRHGLARAICLAEPDVKKRLRQAGFLTRDPRMVERKKYGLKKARRAPQWAKR